MAATVVQAIDEEGHAAASATTDEAGRYFIRLTPGTYTLRVEVDGPYPYCPDTPVTVGDGTPATADIQCDTGIR